PPVVADRDRAAAYRVALDRDDPVGGDESHRASAAARSQRRSMKTEIQMEASKSTRSGTVSSTSDTGSTVGSRIANASIPTEPIPPLFPARAGARSTPRPRH